MHRVSDRRHGDGIFLAQDIEGKKMKKLLKSTVVVIIALGMPLVANGAAPGDKEGIRVNYADLNIENAAGARVLYARLKFASRKACDFSMLTQPQPLAHSAEAKSCYKRALDKAVSRIDSKALSEIHSS